LDYEQLFQTVLKVSNSFEQTEQLFRQLFFNVIFHNRDDHGKNFSMIMNDFGQWRLSPAYDLTFSFGPTGEHSTTIFGEGRNPERKQITKLGKSYGLRLQKMNEIIEQVMQISLKWDSLARQVGISSERIAEIKKRFIKL
jgi:serine/threonine-protein kinase HipA